MKMVIYMISIACIFVGFVLSMATLSRYVESNRQSLSACQAQNADLRGRVKAYDDLLGMKTSALYECKKRLAGYIEAFEECQERGWPCVEVSCRGRLQTCAHALCEYKGRNGDIPEEREFYAKCVKDESEVLP